MKNTAGKVVYVGKAVNLRRRVSSYFLRSQEARIAMLVSEIRKIDHISTDTAIEALILESQLIKKYSPFYNIKEKDDKSFLYVIVTKEEFPRVILAYGKELGGFPARSTFGPFTSASSIREALRIIRRIFPYSIHPPEKIGKEKRSCFEYEIGLCPGTCIGAISRKEYLKTIKNIELFFSGKKERILKSLEKEMGEAAKKTEFERAAKLRKQIFALKHIQDVALIGENKMEGKPFDAAQGKRVECYDISNISGTSAVGSMTVWQDGEIRKSEYRLFKIRTVTGSNDVGMMKEVVSRRLNNHWPLPNLILVDGGVAQAAAAHEALAEKGLRIPVAGIAKGPERKRNDFIGRLPDWIGKDDLIRLRDEAHRFAIGYHRRVRGKNLLS
ncbi:MAG: UvrB/UvrC motif-containing protein [Patescibacteria group bacterium]|nr:UvrB/UvrC motif-containing protein [Patescibacteria group bacterium]